MATERLREVREWVQFALALVTVLIIPAGLLVLRNQRLEIREEMRQAYVSAAVFQSSVNALAVENSSLKSEIGSLNVKIDRIQISLIRLTDAVKLKDQP
jgi:hypothetical protein